MRSPLRCLVTPWGSAPRMFTSSRFILKGDFAATFRLSWELITINFTYGDQPNKGEDPIRGGQSSAFLLHAEGGAPHGKTRRPLVGKEVGRTKEEERDRATGSTKGSGTEDAAK